MKTYWIMGLFLLAGLPALAQAPLPRFASLAASEVNLRTGPGKRYPILWVYRRPALPVEITAEYADWRRVRDPDGVEGWVQSALLSGRYGAIVQGNAATLFSAPRADARALWRAAPGVVGRVDACKQSWCAIKIGDQQGWVLRSEIWGVPKDADFD